MCQGPKLNWKMDRTVSIIPRLNREIYKFWAFFSPGQLILQSQWALHWWSDKLLSRISRLWLNYSRWGLWWCTKDPSLKTRQRWTICGRWIESRISRHEEWIPPTVTHGFDDARGQTWLLLRPRRAVPECLGYMGRLFLSLRVFFFSLVTFSD